MVNSSKRTGMTQGKWGKKKDFKNKARWPFLAPAPGDSKGMQARDGPKE